MIGVRLAGLIGLGLTGTLLSISSWRLVFHSWGCVSCCRRGDDDGDGGGGGEGGAAAAASAGPRVADGITMRRLFHVLLWVAMFCQALGYVDLVFGASRGDGVFSECVGYALLIIVGRSILEYPAFSVVTVYWFRSTAAARAGASETKKVFRIFPALLILAGLALLASSVWEAVDLLGGGGCGAQGKYDDLADFMARSVTYRRQLLVGACAWALHGALIAVCGIMMYKRIRRLPQWRRLRRRKKALVLVRTYTVMLSCAACYLLRAALLVADFAGIEESWATWWVASVWVPSVVPSVLLLYALRRRDRAPGYIDGVPDSSLLPHPVPPEEVFDAFKKSIYDGSVMGDSFDFSLDPDYALGRSTPTNGPVGTYLRFDYESSDEESEALVAT